MPRRDGGDHDERRAARAVAVQAARRAAKPGFLWGLLCGAMIAATAYQYTKSFPTVAERRTVAESLKGNVAFDALFGTIRRIETVAGYTAYKTMFSLIVLLAIWGLFIATRLLRGEEDTGRWELLLAGHTTRRGAALQVAVGLGAGLVALWVPTAVLTVLGGQAKDVDISPTAALFFTTAVVAAAAMFMAVGMLASQLAATRHDANLLGAGVIGGAYLVRMVADSDPGLAWLRWASPIGWIEELRPLTGSRPAAFVPIVALVAVMTAVAVRIAGRRDLGASALASRDTPPPRTLLLGGQAGLTIRLTRGTIIVWLVALGATGLAFGLVTQAAGNALKGAPTLERAMARLGGTAAGGKVYLGYVFLVAAVLVALAVAGQVTAIRNEEAAGHLDNLLVRPVARWQWLAVRLAVGLALVLGSSLLAGVAAWIGVTSQHSTLHFGALVQAGLNVAPPAVFVLGVGALVFGVWPRLAIGFTYGLVLWSLLVETVAAVMDSNHWIRDTSPLLHIAPAPAANPNWMAAGWLVGLGVVAALAGMLAFARRDLAGA